MTACIPGIWTGKAQAHRIEWIQREGCIMMRNDYRRALILLRSNAAAY